MPTRRKQTPACHACGGSCVRSTRPQELEYRGQRLVVEQPGWYCRHCGESVHDGDDMLATEQAFLELKADVDGVLGPSEVRRIRERLQLSQRKASEILGGGPHAFQKYESGEAAVSQPMSNLLRLLDMDPARIKELRAVVTRSAATSTLRQRRSKRASSGRGRRAQLRSPS